MPVQPENNVAIVEISPLCAMVADIMNTRLFFTLSAAIVFGSVVAYAIITWLRQQSQQPMLAPIQPRGEVGFSAIMKQRGELPAA